MIEFQVNCENYAGEETENNTYTRDMKASTGLGKVLDGWREGQKLYKGKGREE